MGSTKREMPWSDWASGHPRMDAIDMLLEGVLFRRKPAKRFPVATRPREFKDVEINWASRATGWDGDVVFEARTKGWARKVQH